MSIQKRGDRYLVRWREGGQQPGRMFARRRDAEAFELEATPRVSAVEAIRQARDAASEPGRRTG